MRADCREGYAGRQALSEHAHHAAIPKNLLTSNPSIIRQWQDSAQRRERVKLPDINGETPGLFTAYRERTIGEIYSVHVTARKPTQED
jgi:hypothetical protein